MRGRCERVLTVVGAVALLAVPGVAMAKKDHGANPPPASSGAAPPNQLDLFQNLSLGSNKEPINITADGMELDYKANVLTYSGNVKVVQGDATLTSDRLEITFERQSAQPSPSPAGPGETPAAPQATPAPAAGPSPSPSPKALGDDTNKIKQVVADGHVRMQRGDRVAEGRHAVFDQAKQTVVLTENAVLHEGQNQVTGDRIVVYLQDQRSVVESTTNTRVNAIFYPNTGSSGSPGTALTPRPQPTPAAQASAGGH